MPSPQQVRHSIWNVIHSHPSATADVENGNHDAANYLTAKVLRRTEGSADPNTVQRLIRDTLTQ